MLFTAQICVGKHWYCAFLCKMPHTECTFVSEMLMNVSMVFIMDCRINGEVSRSSGTNAGPPTLDYRHPLQVFCSLSSCISRWLIMARFRIRSKSSCSYVGLFRYGSYNHCGIRNTMNSNVFASCFSQLEIFWLILESDCLVRASVGLVLRLQGQVLASGPSAVLTRLSCVDRTR